VLEVAKVLFAEAGNQSRENRRLIARMIVNRLYTPDYQKTIWGIIHRDNSFSCTFDGSLQWKKANWQAHKNNYEEHEFQECLEDASAVMQKGWRANVPWEKDAIAYHDTSIKVPNDKYWNSLKPVGKVGRLVWYVKR
jgi:spore germination cell wall hydrolase CwlJ-like protein